MLCSSVLSGGITWTHIAAGLGQAVMRARDWQICYVIMQLFALRGRQMVAARNDRRPLTDRGAALGGWWFMIQRHLVDSGGSTRCEAAFKLSACDVRNCGGRVLASLCWLLPIDKR